MCVSTQQAMSSSEVFHGIPDEVVQRFRTAGIVKLFRLGDTIFREGDRGGSFYFVIRGGVQATKSGAFVADFAEGNFFGEIAALTGQQRTATLKTTSESIIYELPKVEFWKLLETDFNLAITFETIAEMRLLALKQPMAVRP